MNNEQVSSKNVLLVECLKQPGVENMAFRTNPFLLATNSPRSVSIEISNTATEELLNKVGGLLHA